MTTAVICDGSVTLSPDGSPLCSTGWATIPYEALVPFDVSNLVIPDLMTAFTFGIFLTATPVAVAKGMSVILNLVQKA